YAAAASRDFPVFVSRGYATLSAVVDDVTVESFWAEGDEKPGKAVLAHAAAALSEYQKRLGPYPYSTFRVVESRLTGGAGGMEFPGLVTVATGLYRGVGDPLSALGMG